MKVTSVIVGLATLNAAYSMALSSSSFTNIRTVTVTGTDTSLTHRYGRFDKTRASSRSSSSNTHRYGRFDKTKPRSTQTIYVQRTGTVALSTGVVRPVDSNASNSSNATVSSTANGANLMGVSLGSAAIVGGVAMLLL